MTSNAPYVFRRAAKISEAARHARIDMNAKTTPTTTSESNIYGGIATADPEIHFQLWVDFWEATKGEHKYYQGGISRLENLAGDLAFDFAEDSGHGLAAKRDLYLATMSDGQILDVADEVSDLARLARDSADEGFHEDEESLAEALIIGVERLLRFRRVRRELCEEYNLTTHIPA